MADPVDALINSLKYKNASRVKRDVKYLINHYTDLRPKIGHHNMHNRKEKLFYLKGTIPIMYKVNTYNIPIEIWLPENYPLSPPMCYVTPTPTMEIKPSNYVGQDGKIKLPYIQDWKQNSSDLMGTVQIAQSVFTENCPVFTKIFPTPQGPGGAGLPYPLNPPVGALPYPSVASPFPATPYPIAAGGYPIMMSNQNAVNSYQGQELDPNGAYASPIDEEAIKESLLSAVQDRIKFRLKDTFSQAQVEMDNLLKTEQRLKDGAVVIDNILRVLGQENAQAEVTCQKLSEGIVEASRTLEKFGGVEKDNDFRLDEAVVAANPVHKQILNSYAEESAIVDATYYLGEALKRGALDLDLFLKNVRELSRRQFTLKALMQKCRQRAGLAI